MADATIKIRMKPARLPHLGEYLTRISPMKIRQELWSWVSSIPVRDRRKARVVDLHFPPGPDGFLGDEWEPVAEHPEWSIWIVRRAG